MKIKIAYEDLSKFDGWSRCRSAIERVIVEHDLKKICELGAGCHPTLPLDVVQKLGLDYTMLDISAEELAKAPPGYTTWCADIAAADFAVKGGFDLIFSRMVMEHVTNARQAHQNVLAMLGPKGYAIHFFPTLYTLPFVINLLLDESVDTSLLNWFAPRKTGKFKAYYDWCRGPTAPNIGRLRELGYEIAEYRGYFGHLYYRKIPVLRELHDWKTKFLLKYPISWLTNYAAVVLQKP